MLPARAAPARKATNVMRLKTDRRGVAFPGSEEVFMVTPCRWKDDEHSAPQLLAVFAGGVKICKASRKPGRVLLRLKRQRIGENAHLPVFSYEEQQFEQCHLVETRAQFRPEILRDVAPVLQRLA